MFFADRFALDAVSVFMSVSMFVSVSVIFAFIFVSDVLSGRFVLASSDVAVDTLDHDMPFSYTSVDFSFSTSLKRFAEDKDMFFFFK